MSGAFPCAQAARHTHAMRSRLQDLVDLLLGWSLEPDLPTSARSALPRPAHAPLLCFAALHRGVCEPCRTIACWRMHDGSGGGTTPVPIC